MYKGVEDLSDINLNQENPTASGRGIKESKWKKAIKKYYIPYMYIAPFYLLFIIFGAFPIIYAFYLSFHKWNGLDAKIYIGFENYVLLFNNPVFWKAAYNTLFITVIAHIPMLIIALIVAFIINSGMIKFKDFFRTVYFLPVLTSSVAISIVFLTIFGVRAGLVNYALSFIGVDPIDWWGGSGQWIKPAIIILFIWKWLGYNMVIYLAGLQAIPNELYQAAQIDGASYTQIFTKITLPLLKPVVLFTIIMSGIGGITIFDEPYMLVGPDGGTNNEGLTLMVYLYREAFQYVHFGYASAIAYAVSFFIVVVSIVNMRLFGNSNA